MIQKIGKLDGQFEELELEGSSAAVVQQVLSRKWPNLRRLVLRCASVAVRDFAPLVEGKAFPSLVHLGLRGLEDSDELAEALANGLLLRRLNSLDLAEGTLTATGVRALAAKKKGLSLESLDLTANHLDASGRALTKGLATKVTSRDQI